MSSVPRRDIAAWRSNAMTLCARSNDVPRRPQRCATLELEVDLSRRLSGVELSGNPKRIFHGMLEAMKGLTALALLAIAIVAIIYFWPRTEPRIAPLASQNASHRDSVLTPSGSAKPVQGPPTASARPAEQAAQPGTIARAPATAARIELRAADTVRSGDTFLVTIDVQALRAMRHLEFSVTYEKSILQLLESSPGTFAHQEGTIVQFEESSDGTLLVRIDSESGVIAGAGTVGLLEFQARRPGASLLSIDDVIYVESGGAERATAPEVQERSITVVD